MGIVQHRSADKTVQTISDRNAIAPKRDHMTVVVLDAIGDLQVGGGKAVYRWSADTTSWVLIARENQDVLNFARERKTISADVVQMGNVPAGETVWDVYVDLGSNVIAQVEWSIGGSQIRIYPDTPGEFDGKTLCYQYAYGSVAQQIATVIAGTPGVPGPKGDAGADGRQGIDGVAGVDGRELEMRKGTTHLQTRYIGSLAWLDVVALADITGPAGADGVTGKNIELRATATDVQWRVADGVSTWATLLALSAITGAKGDPGTTTWAGITDKPPTFAPSAHTHTTEINAAIALWEAAASTLTNKTMSAVTLTGGVTEQAQAFVTAGSSKTLSLAAGSIIGLTLNSPSCALTFPTVGAGKAFTLFLKQDATGNRLVGWPANVRWTDSVTITLTTTANKIDIVSFIGDPSGTFWVAFVGGKNWTLA